ncbi:protein FAM162A-like [Lithobates pipiens]
MLRAALGRSGLRLLAERSVMGRGDSAVVVMGRHLCSKPENEGQSFKISTHRPSNFEKKILLWGGRFKKESDIPEFVSYEMVDGAKSKVRVKFSVIMMLLTIMGCIGMVISGKRAAGRHETLANLNLEKKARFKSGSEE